MKKTETVTKPDKAKAIIESVLLEALIAYEETQKTELLPEARDEYSWIPQFMSRRQMAEKLSCNIQTVIMWELKDGLKAVRMGGIVRYHRPDVIEWIERMKNKKLHRVVKRKY